MMQLMKIRNASTNRNLAGPVIVCLTGCGVFLFAGAREDFVVLTFDRNAHTSCSSFDDSGGVVFIAGVQIADFSLGDFADLRLVDLESFVLAGALFFFLGRQNVAAFFLFNRDAGRLFEQHSRRWALDFEREGAVAE